MNLILILLKGLKLIVSIISMLLHSTLIIILLVNLLSWYILKIIPDIMYLIMVVSRIIWLQFLFYTVKWQALSCRSSKLYYCSLFIFFYFFILKVLALKSCSAFTVEEITERFCISTSTLYRWISKYNVYLRIFNTLKNRYHMHFFVHLIYDFSNVIHDIFDFNLHTLFQYDRTLSNHDSWLNFFSFN